MGADATDIASFKTTECYHQVKNRLRMFFLRGNTVDPDYLREAGVLKKAIQVQSSVQVVNILGYVLNKPVANFDKLSADQVEDLLRSLRTGDACFIEEAARKPLEKVVKQMKSFRFELIPLIVVTNRDNAGKNFESLLIKVHEKGGAVSYVDLSGRIYSSFKNFLDQNKLPPSILCYPKDGVVAFDANNKIDVDCCVVGTTNARKGAVDVLVGMVGAAGTVGTIFATGGLAVPFVVVSCGSALYATGRSIEKLIDAGAHGMTLNPFEDAEARNNWLMMSANLLTFASLGVAGLATKLEGLTATQISRFLLANRIIRGVSAGVNAVTVVDSIAFMVNNWKRMSIYEKISVACAVCFCFREVISFANAERLIRNCQIEGICRFFKGSVVGGISSVGQGFVTNVKGMFEGNDAYVSTGMHLIRTMVLDSFDVTVSNDFWTIRLFGFEYKTRNIISMTETELSKFLYMIQGIAKTFRDGFALLRVFCGDGPILSAVSKRAEEAGGNRADYGKAINEMIEVFMAIKRVTNDFSILTNAQLSIGGGHQFTVASAFRTFISPSGISLLRALLEMNPRQIKRMNDLRGQWGSEEGNVFAFITYSSADSSEMMVKIRFLLAVFDICTEKSLRMTEIQPTEQIVEIETLVRVGPEQFNQSAYPDYLIDPKLLRICQTALQNHRGFIDTVWNKTCAFNSNPFDRAFEKLKTLEMALQTYSSATVENVISYASQMDCPDFARFTYHVLFALKSMDNLTHEVGLEETAANEILFTDPAVLQSRFLELTMKADELSLGGYCPVVDYDSVTAEQPRLIETIKGLASKAQLRFGTIENGALHLDMYPMLRFGAEIIKFNRYIELKRFDREEVKLINDGKLMVYFGNEQLQIVVGVVRELGAYIDTYSFTHSNQ